MIKCKAISAHFLRTSTEKTRARLPSLKKGLKVYPASSPAPSESGRKRGRHAAHTSLAHSTPWMLCVKTHHPSDPSGAKTPPRSAFATNIGGSRQRPFKTLPPKKHSGQDLSPVFSFDALKQRLAEGVPVSIYQGRAPPLLCYGIVVFFSRALGCLQKNLNSLRQGSPPEPSTQPSADRGFSTTFFVPFLPLHLFRDNTGLGVRRCRS